MLRLQSVALHFPFSQRAEVRFAQLSGILVGIPVIHLPSRFLLFLEFNRILEIYTFVMARYKTIL